jgi:hypothetical protein
MENKTKNSRNLKSRRFASSGESETSQSREIAKQRRDLRHEKLYTEVSYEGATKMNPMVATVPPNAQHRGQKDINNHLQQKADMHLTM